LTLPGTLSLSETVRTLELKKMRASNIFLMTGLAMTLAAAAPRVAFADDPISDMVDSVVGPMTPAETAPEAAPAEQPAHSHYHCHSRSRCHAHGHAGSHHR
jgi:hypothetical protein